MKITSKDVLRAIEAIGEVALGGLEKLFPPERKTTYDSNLVPSSEMFSVLNKGFCISGKAISLKASTMNFLLIGKTGSSKSVAIATTSAQNLLGNASLLVNDPSGELAERISGAAHKLGYKVIYINYTNPKFGGFNPLKRIRNRSDIAKLSELIVFAALGKGRDPFWNTAASQLLAILIELVLSLPEKFHCMYCVVQLLNKFSYKPKFIDKLVVRANNPALLSEYSVFCSYDSKVTMSVVATLKAATKVFTDPNVALSTSYDSVSFEECLKEKTLILINNRVVSMRYYGLVSSLFFSQFFEVLLSRRAKKGDLPVFMIIDEASSLYINDLEIALANVRKSLGGLMLIFQSYNQIVNMYSAEVAKSIAENCHTKAFLPGQGLEISREISATLGYFEYEDKGGAKRNRLVLTPDEVHRSNNCIVSYGNIFTQLSLVGYYKISRFKSMALLPPYYPPPAAELQPLPSIDELDEEV